MNNKNISNSVNQEDFSELKFIVYQLGEIVRNNIFGNLEVQEKKGNELVTWIDKMIEQKAKQLIRDKYGNVDFMGEEYGIEDNGSDYKFIIDPLDGTESMINREFNTTISIGVEIRGELKYGIVYDFMKDILYEKTDESNIYFNKNKIDLLRDNYSEQIKILISGRGEELIDIQKKLEQNKNLRVSRAYGSVALQVVQTGAGNYDGFVRVGKIKTWDIAGATPFINGLNDTEVLSREGKNFDHNNPEKGVIVVRNEFKDEFLEIIT